MSKAKAEIKALAITIGDVEVSLTIEQAKQLHAALHEMFKAKPAPINIIERRYERYPWWPGTGPYWYSGSHSGLTLDSNKHQSGLGSTSLDYGNSSLGSSSGSIKFQNLLMAGK